MSNMGRAIAFMMLAAGLVIVLVGLGLVQLPDGGGGGGGGGGTGTTTTGTSTTTQTTTFTPLTGRLIIWAVDDQGRTLAAQIYVNDELVSSSGFANLTKPEGLYRVRWGDIPNYRTPQPQDVLVTHGEETRVHGVYVPNQVQTFKLTVKVRVCSSLAGTCYWHQGAVVKVGDLYQGETNSNGVVIFNVRAGTYTVTVTSQAFGTQSQQVIVNQDTEVLFTYRTGGFSILGLPDGGLMALLFFLAILALLFMFRRRR